MLAGPFAGGMLAGPFVATSILAGRGGMLAGPKGAYAGGASEVGAFA